MEVKISPARAKVSDKPSPIEIVKKLLENPCLILAIVCARNYVGFVMVGEKTEKCRITFEELLKELNVNIFLQIHRCWVINKHCMVDQQHDDKGGWIKLTEGYQYSISETYIQDFRLNLPFMLKYQRSRERLAKTRPSKKAFSKYSEYFCEED